MADTLTFDDLTLHQAAFEVRYKDAFLIWDRSGGIWSRVISIWPELKASHAEPNKIIFRSDGDQQTQLTLERQRLIVVVIDPDKKLSEFSKLVVSFADIATQALEIAVYDRVGLRVSFVKEYPDRESAAAAFLETGLIQLPREPQFGLSAPVIHPEIAIRREDGKNGFSLRLKAETVSFDFEPAFGLAHVAERRSIVKHRVHLDVDCYIEAPVEPTKLYFSDWIEQTLHIMKRDGRKFFRE